MDKAGQKTRGMTIPLCYKDEQDYIDQKGFMHFKEVL